MFAGRVAGSPRQLGTHKALQTTAETERVFPRQTPRGRHRHPQQSVSQHFFYFFFYVFIAQFLVQRSSIETNGT